MNAQQIIETSRAIATGILHNDYPVNSVAWKSARRSFRHYRGGDILRGLRGTLKSTQSLAFAACIRRELRNA